MADAIPVRARPRSFFDGWETGFGAFAVATALAILTIVLHWRGSDLPAQVFRADLVRRDGFVVWNSQWFGGHATLAYSVIAPLVGSITGPVALGAVSCVVSAVLFERVVRFAFGRVSVLGAMWFAVGTVTNLIVGRVTFAMGVAFGLAAIYALQRKHPVAVVVFGVLCALASPLAGAFLAIALAAYAMSHAEDRLLCLIAVAATLLPIAAVALLFPTPGAQPYELWALIWDLSFCAIIFAAAGRYPVLRWGAAFYACAAVGSYLMPSALGGNVSRMGQYLVGPILACLLLRQWRWLLAALAVPLLMWQWVPTFDGIVWSPRDPSTHASYYTPVVSFLTSRTGPIGRVEIPFTYRHWETAYVAPKIPLARGWERQLDIAYNPLFYASTFSGTAYRRWLAENGVAYVALPDAQLDDSSKPEKLFLLHGAPWLHKVWHDVHWTVWSVAGFHGLVDGPGTVTSLTPDKVTLSVRRPGSLTVLVRDSGHWALSGDACARASRDGWTRVQDAPSGTVVMTVAFRGSHCPA
jgi:hypothetical protein